jgi:hypothetical protein
VTDFVNLKIKPAQSFGRAHRGKVCVSECSYVYEFLRLYCVSKKRLCTQYVTAFIFLGFNTKHKKKP